MDKKAFKPELAKYFINNRFLGPVTRIVDGDALERASGTICVQRDLVAPKIALDSLNQYEAFCHFSNHVLPKEMVVFNLAKLEKDAGITVGATTIVAGTGVSGTITSQAPGFSKG